MHPFNYQALLIHSAAVNFAVGAKASNMADVIALRSYSCVQPQSLRALLSSRTWGQLSAAREYAQNQYE